MNRSPALAARRVRQTVSTFSNGWQVLADLGLQRVRPRDVLEFEVRNGPRVLAPNVPGARVPVYEVFAEDAYRLPELLAPLPADPVVLDIGGHIGCFSLAVARLVPAARVHAYEASPSTTAWLTRNVEANRLADRITVHGEAVGAARGTIRFTDNGAGSVLNGLTAPEGSGEIEVPSVTLADAFSAAGGHVDLVKIDTEGAEYDMVLAGDPGLWRDVAAVVIEYHDVPGHDWAELAEFFRVAGFDVVATEPVGPRLGTAWLRRAVDGSA